MTLVWVESDEKTILWIVKLLMMFKAKLGNARNNQSQSTFIDKYISCPILWIYS
jgi:hypothetical protein